MKKVRSVKQQLAIDSGVYTGRPANKDSKRQRGMKYLDEYSNTKREFIIPAMMKKFDIGKNYAETIHATWRTQNKETGELIVIYTVKDLKRGKPVTPYIKKEFVVETNSSQTQTVEGAKLQYIARQQENATIVNNL